MAAVHSKQIYYMVLLYYGFKLKGQSHESLGGISWNLISVSCRIRVVNNATVTDPGSSKVKSGRLMRFFCKSALRTKIITRQFVTDLTVVLTNSLDLDQH